MLSPRWLGIAGSTRFVRRGSPDRTGWKNERLSRFAFLRVSWGMVVGELCYFFRSEGISKKLVLVRAGLQAKAVCVCVCVYSYTYSYTYIFRLTICSQRCRLRINTSRCQVWSKHDQAVRAWQSFLFLGWSSCWWPSQHKALNKPQDIFVAVLLCKPQTVLAFLLGRALCTFPFLFHRAKVDQRCLFSIFSLNLIVKSKAPGLYQRKFLLLGFFEPHQDLRLNNSFLN